MGFFHHIGTFLLFTATVLLVIPTISAPVVNNLGLLKVNLGNATASHETKIIYGTFGYCVTDTAADNKDYCTSPHVGYNATAVLSSIATTSFSHGTTRTTNALTTVLVLHPVVLGLSCLAFLLALGAGVLGSLLAALAALAALVVTLVALVADYVLFAVLKDHVNNHNSRSSSSSSSAAAAAAHAEYGVAIWAGLAAAVCSLLGALGVAAACCAARRRRSRADSGAKSDYGAPPAAAGGRRWWQRG